jgi:hypothetical protein
MKPGRDYAFTIEDTYGDGFMGFFVISTNGKNGNDNVLASGPERDFEYSHTIDFSTPASMSPTGEVSAAPSVSPSAEASEAPSVSPSSESSAATSTEPTCIDGMRNVSLRLASVPTLQFTAPLRARRVSC